MKKPRRKYESSARYAQGEETRAQILLAAGKNFADRGFSGTSIRDIADDSGVGLSTVLYHFGSKENLILETIRHFTVGMGRLNSHFAPLFEMDVADPQAVSNALRDAIHSFLHACHGPQSVENLLGLYLRVLAEGDRKALKMLLDCFADVQVGLVQWVRRIRPGIDDVQVGLWQQLLWSLLQYTVVSKRLVLYDMDLDGDYSEAYLAAAAWHFAWYCCLPLQLPPPEKVS